MFSVTSEPGRADPPGERGGVVEQHLVLADLDEQRRQPRQVGSEQRRGERVGRLGVAQVRVGHEHQVVGAQHWIEGLEVPARGRGLRQVHPRRQADRGARSRQPGVADRQQRRDDQAAAGAVARQCDPVRCDATAEQVGVRGERVVECGGERVLGSEAVVERHERHAAREREATDELPVAVERPGAVAPAVEVQHDAVPPGITGDEPLGGTSSEGVPLGGDAVGRHDPRGRGGHLLAPLEHAAAHDVGPGQERRDRLDAWMCHVPPPVVRHDGGPGRHRRAVP